MKNYTSKKSNKDSRGFTIIEVLIVLAIAALILLIVFLVVPHLKRTHRNYNRKHDASLLVSIVSEFIINNNKVAPTVSCTGNACPFLQDVELSQFEISKVFYENITSSTLADYFTGNPDDVGIYSGAHCAVGGNGDQIASNYRQGVTRNSVAVVFQIESTSNDPGVYLYTDPNWDKSLRQCLDGVI